MCSIIPIFQCYIPIDLDIFTLLENFERQYTNTNVNNTVQYNDKNFLSKFFNLI